MPRLLIGPVLRHVGTTDATVFVETDEAVRGRDPRRARAHLARRRAPLRAGHRRRASQPATSTSVRGAPGRRAVWPPLDSSRPPSRIRTLGDDGEIRLAFGSCRYSRAASKIDDKHFDPDSLAAYARELTTQDESDVAERHPHARRPGLCRRDHRGDPAAHPRQARRSPKTARAPRSPTSRSTPGSTSSRGPIPTCAG